MKCWGITMENKIYSRKDILIKVNNGEITAKEALIFILSKKEHPYTGFLSY